MIEPERRSNVRRKCKKNFQKTTQERHFYPLVPALRGEDRRFPLLPPCSGVPNNKIKIEHKKFVWKRIFLNEDLPQ